MDDKLIEELKINDLSEPYDQIANAIGLDATIKLAKEFGGEMMYLPKIETLLQPLRDKLIRKEFNGYNYEALARKYGLTSRWVRQIVASIESTVRNRPMEGQMSIEID